MSATRTGNFSLYSTPTFTFTDALLVSDHNYAIMWGVVQDDPAAGVVTPNDLITPAAGSLVASLPLGTEACVALFDSGTKKPVDGFLRLYDLTDEVEVYLAPYALTWAPEPDSFVEPDPGGGVAATLDQVAAAIAAVPSTAKATPVGADMIPIFDSEDGNARKYITVDALAAVLKTYFDTLYTPL